MTNNLLLIGEIVAAQGLRGQVRVNVASGNPQELAEHEGFTDQHGNAISLKLNGTKGRQAIVSVKGITDRNGAEKLVSTKLFVSRETLPLPGEGEYYYTDLIGLEVRDASTKLGIITAMHNFGAGDIMELRLVNGKTDMLLFNPNIVKEVNIAGGYIVIEMPDILVVQE